ncbi:hypothetical protein GJ496_006979 [Pomphorhynchus laevis]|nr:hypothetical protein GJ496_006979 [Pomphorhynchus laevis]
MSRIVFKIIIKLLLMNYKDKLDFIEEFVRDQKERLLHRATGNDIVNGSDSGQHNHCRKRKLSLSRDNLISKDLLPSRVAGTIRYQKIDSKRRNEFAVIYFRVIIYNLFASDNIIKGMHQDQSEKVRYREPSEDQKTHLIKMYSVAIFTIIVTLGGSYANQLQLGNIKSCDGISLPRDFKFGPCLMLIGNKCVLKHENRVKQHVTFEDHEHAHNFELKVCSEIDGNHYERVADPSGVNVNCAGSKCTMDHDFKVHSHFPIGTHEVKFQMTCKDTNTSACCYKADIEIQA